MELSDFRVAIFSSSYFATRAGSKLSNPALQDQAYQYELQEDTRYHVLINCVILALCKKELDRLSLELLEQYPVVAMVYSHTIKSGSFFYLKFSRRARILGWLNSACAP
jgi:hypothetical protein